MDANELNALIVDHRAKQAPAPPPQSKGWEPCRVRKTLDEVTAKILAIPSPPPLPATEIKRRRENAIAQERLHRWRQFAEQLGPRYLGCRFANFDIQEGPHAGAQEAVLDELHKYADTMSERIGEGQSVLLNGT